MVWNPLTQHRLASRDFFTVGILFFDKFFWKISSGVVKKIISSSLYFKCKRDKGFYELMPCNARFWLVLKIRTEQSLYRKALQILWSEKNYKLAISLKISFEPAVRIVYHNCYLKKLLRGYIGSNVNTTVSCSDKAVNIIFPVILINRLIFKKNLFGFQVGNTGSFSHFCRDQPVPDEVNYL